MSYKCKKCGFKHGDRKAIREHVKGSHYVKSAKKVPRPPKAPYISPVGEAYERR